MLKNTKDNYGAVAKLFHWVVALLIIGMLIVGFVMVGMAMSPDKFKLIGLHKSFGITVLILVALRLIWKAVNPAPALPGTLSVVEKMLAHLGHAFLYILMAAMPLTGWAMSSASGFTVSVFGLFSIPNITQADAAMKKYFVDLHGTLAWVLIGMITLHVLAALLHHFYHKNDVLLRMLPFIKRGKNAPGS